MFFIKLLQWDFAFKSVQLLATQTRFHYFSNLPRKYFLLMSHYCLIIIASLSTIAFLMTQDHKWSIPCSWLNSLDICSYRHSLKSRVFHQNKNLCIFMKSLCNFCQFLHSSIRRRPLYRKNDFSKITNHFVQYSKTFFRYRDKRLWQIKSLLMSNFLWNPRAFT